MIHDPLCPGCVAADGLCDSNCASCLCDLIAKAREDERRRWDGQSVVLASTIKQEGEQG